MYSSFSDDSVPFLTVVGKGHLTIMRRVHHFKKELSISNHRWTIVFGGDAHSVMWGGEEEDDSHIPIGWSWPFIVTFFWDPHGIRPSWGMGEPMRMTYRQVSMRIHPEWMWSIVCIMDHGSMTVWWSILMTQTFGYDFSTFIYTEKITMIWHNFFGFFRWPPPQNFIYHLNT